MAVNAHHKLGASRARPAASAPDAPAAAVLPIVCSGETTPWSVLAPPLMPSMLPPSLDPFLDQHLAAAYVARGRSADSFLVTAAVYRTSTSSRSTRTAWQWR